MNTIKDLMNNEELLKHVTEDLEDFDADSEVSYEVWAIGYDSDDDITDVEVLLYDSVNPDEAVQFAKNLTLAEILHKVSEETGNNDFRFDTAYFSIEVETVVEDEDDCTMNIGTVYKKDVVNEDYEDELVHLKEADYTLDEDGNLIVACSHLNHFNKNDIIKVMFDDENNTPVLTYKINSKTTDNNFICEFMY